MTDHSEHELLARKRRSVFNPWDAGLVPPPGYSAEDYKHLSDRELKKRVRAKKGPFWYMGV